MDPNPLIASLERFPGVLLATVGGMGAGEVRWRPPDGGWTLLEIVAHVADEETHDFRPRLESTLEDPSREWAPIDPERRVVERDFNAGHLAATLARFVSERSASIAWLRSLADPDWARAHAHPSLGELRAGDLLLSWAEHDWLHLRQIAKRMYQLALRAGEGFDAGYAGPW